MMSQVTRKSMGQVGCGVRRERAGYCTCFFVLLLSSQIILSIFGKEDSEVQQLKRDIKRENVQRPGVHLGTQPWKEAPITAGWDWTSTLNNVYL